MQLHPRIKRWVDELRSGKYRQGSGWLRAKDARGGDDFYCCLGIAANLYVEDHPDSNWHIETGWRYFYDDRDQEGCGDQEGCASSYLGDDALDWLGIDVKQMEELAEMNDSGKTFDEIANRIEQTAKEGKFHAPTT